MLLALRKHSVSRLRVRPRVSRTVAKSLCVEGIETCTRDTWSKSYD